MKGKGTVVNLLTFRFNIKNCLIEGSNTAKKKYDRISQSFMFFRMLSICILSNFSFKCKGSQGCQCLCLSSHNVSHLYHLKSHGVPIYHGLNRIPCSGIMANTIGEWSNRNHGYTYYIHLLCLGFCFIIT